MSTDLDHITELDQITDLDQIRARINQRVDLAFELIAPWEGFSAVPYLCTGRKPTIGFGTTRYPDGRFVTLADPPVTRQHAIVIAKSQIRGDYLRTALAACPNLVEPRKIASLGSLVYNIGGPAFRGSTLRRVINAEDWDQVPTQWRRWNRSGGRVTRGLVNRREAELRFGGWIT